MLVLQSQRDNVFSRLALADTLFGGPIGRGIQNVRTPRRVRAVEVKQIYEPCASTDLAQDGCGDTLSSLVFAMTLLPPAKEPKMFRPCT